MKTEKQNVKEFFSKDEIESVNELFDDSEDGSKNEIVPMTSIRGRDQIVVVKEGDDVFVKQLKLTHYDNTGASTDFEIDDESDGTSRLLDFIPAFRDILTTNKVILVDEIERSIHPLLIKELIRKFSEDKKSKGQLIFTTHESNLLDQDIFRQDEIWFVEKSPKGNTDLYSLSDYKEHNTIDIRKGYLNGRYGSIPFLGNLADLNWHKYDSNE